MTAINRRSLLALAAAALVPAQWTSRGGYSFASVAEAHGAEIAADATTVVCGGPNGSAALLYVANPRVDAAFVARHPKASFISCQGQGYRLAAENLTVEAFGAAGDGITNDQPAIQEAIHFAEATGCPTVRFTRRSYAVWSPRRENSLGGAMTYDGLPIIVARTLALQGLPSARSTLYFRNVDGRELAQSWQVVNGQVWRGAGIFLKGTDPLVQGATPPSITLTDLNLDGGCDRGQEFGFPARLSDGDGWDMTHKGLWAENDMATGDWLIQRCAVRRFRGELIYQGGRYHGAITMRDVEFSDTNADILNPCGTNLDIDGGYFHTGFQGWEGWGGRNGRIVNSLFEDCHALGGMQGGKAYTATREKGAFTRPTPFTPNVKPWLELDIKVVNCGPIYLGSWVRGRIDMTDSVLALSAGVFHSISDVSLNVVARCRSRHFPAAVSISGPASGPAPFQRIAVDLVLEPSPAGSGYGKAINELGSVGPDVVVRTANG